MFASLINAIFSRQSKLERQWLGKHVRAYRYGEFGRSEVIGKVLVVYDFDEEGQSLVLDYGSREAAAVVWVRDVIEVLP